MEEKAPWTQETKAKEDPQLCGFLDLARWLGNVLFVLGFVSGIAAFVTVLCAGRYMGLWLAAIGQALGAVLCFLLGAFVSAGGQVLVRCVLSVEQPHGAPPVGS